MAPESQKPAVLPEVGDALLIADLQNDFLPGGALGVAGGNEVIPVLNKWIDLFQERGLPILASRDWHPPKHCSFKEQGGPWPPHCVRETPGAAFVRTLRLPLNVRVISKATKREKEAYSAFQETPLKETLDDLNVHRIFIGGLATDYCILNTVKDALENGFDACVIRDGIQAIDLEPGDGARAIEEMAGLGAKIL